MKTSVDRSLWALDPAVVFLNHGSFGACPKAVLDAQRDFRERMEAEPVQFFKLNLDGLLDEARRELGAFVGAKAEDLAFVPNATTAVNTVFRSVPLRSGDEILTTDHAYNACKNALDFAAGTVGAHVNVARVPFPIDSPEMILEVILGAVTPKTRWALIDHITSPTGLIFPIARIVKELEGRGVHVMVDGAHAPGMVPLNIEEIGASIYTGNCHKWLCSPKGAAFLWVRKDLQKAIRPLVISHGATDKRTDRSKYHLEFDWTGTDDPTAYLSVPAAIRTLGSFLPGGWPEVMKTNHGLALEAQRMLCDVLQIPPPAPAEMVGSMASFPLLDEFPMEILFDRHSIEVPVNPWPHPPKRLLRISAQLYNRIDEYERLATALKTLVSSPRK